MATRNDSLKATAMPQFYVHDRLPKAIFGKLLLQCRLVSYSTLGLSN